MKPEEIKTVIASVDRVNTFVEERKGAYFKEMAEAIAPYEDVTDGESRLLADIREKIRSAPYADIFDIQDLDIPDGYGGSLMFSGEETWSYGGHEYHVVDVPFAYIFGAAFDLDKAPIDKEIASWRKANRAAKQKALEKLQKELA
tara:strand:+ start:18978 stop:19412 length:435 start_codon:yes stop_codon:yes gene_type:complete